jgi:enamine deaminase RidA (YjgF/YER057c/UK114 family)
MNFDGVDRDSELDEAMTDTPPDIADAASAAKQDFRKNLETCITLKMSTIKSKIYISSFFVKRKQVRHFHYI